jgi:hypothetical protein
MEQAYYAAGGAAAVVTLIWYVIRIYGDHKRQKMRDAVQKLRDLAAEALRRKQTHIDRPTGDTGPAVAVVANEMKKAASNPLLTKEILALSNEYASVLRDGRCRNVNREFKALDDEIHCFLDHLNGIRQ